MKKMEIKLCDITDKHKTLIKEKGLSLDRTINDANTWLENNPKKPQIKIYLKYYGNNVSVINNINRISKVSTRVYLKKNKLPKILNGFGTAVISTPIGLLTDRDARKFGNGGEVLFMVE